MLTIQLKDAHTGRGTKTVAFTLRDATAFKTRDVTRPAKRVAYSGSTDPRCVTIQWPGAEGVRALIKVVDASLNEPKCQHAVWKKKPLNVPRVYGYGAVVENSAELRAFLGWDASKAPLSVVVMEFIEGSLTENLDLLTREDVPLLVATMHSVQKSFYQARREIHNDPLPRNILMRLDPHAKTIKCFVLADYGKTKKVTAADDFEDACRKWMSFLVIKLDSFAARWAQESALPKGSLLLELAPVAFNGRSFTERFRQIARGLTNDSSSDDETADNSYFDSFAEVSCAHCEMVPAAGLCMSCGDWAGLVCSEQCLLASHTPAMCQRFKEGSLL